MNCPWYPPTTYEPAAGTGVLLVNPPFDAMTDRIETTCRTAADVMAKGCVAAITTGRRSELQAPLAEVLDVFIAAGISGSQWMDCAAHLKVNAERGRVG
jgi:hypothetical protein